MRPVLRSSLIILSAATVWLASSPEVTAHTQTSYESPIDAPRSTATGPDQFVVSFAVGGELHGLLTLTLTRAGQSASGEWALVTSTVAPEGAEGEEHDHDQLVDSDNPSGHVDLGPPTFSGTLAGTITNAELVFDDQGTLVAIDSASLTVVSGSVRFDGASGSGTAQATSIDPGGEGSAEGSLKLSLNVPAAH